MADVIGSFDVFSFVNATVPSIEAWSITCRSDGIRPAAEGFRDAAVMCLADHS
jgi:hypothetical protein